MATSDRNFTRYYVIDYKTKQPVSQGFLTEEEAKMTAEYMSTFNPLIVLTVEAR